jgi:hypothetical protein
MSDAGGGRRRVTAIGFNRPDLSPAPEIPSPRAPVRCLEGRGKAAKATERRPGERHSGAASHQAEERERSKEAESAGLYCSSGGYGWQSDDEAAARGGRCASAAWPRSPVDGGGPWTPGLAPCSLRTAGVCGERARLARPSSARRRPLVLARCAHAGSDALAAARRRGMATISSYQNPSFFARICLTVGVRLSVTTHTVDCTPRLRRAFVFW